MEPVGITVASPIKVRMQKTPIKMMSRERTVSQDPSPFFLQGSVGAAGVGSGAGLCSTSGVSIGSTGFKRDGEEQYAVPEWWLDSWQYSRPGNSGLGGPERPGANLRATDIPMYPPQCTAGFPPRCASRR